MSSSPYSPQTAADPTGLAPMEIDRVKRGKAAGKGKVKKTNREKGRWKAKSRRARAKPMVSKTNGALRQQLRGAQFRKAEKVEIRTTRAKARASQKMVWPALIAVELGIWPKTVGECDKLETLRLQALFCLQWLGRRVLAHQFHRQPQQSSEWHFQLENMIQWFSTWNQVRRQAGVIAGWWNSSTLTMRNASLRQSGALHLVVRPAGVMSSTPTSVMSSTPMRLTSSLTLGLMHRSFHRACSSAMWSASGIARCSRQGNSLLGQRSVAAVLEDKNGVEIEVRDNVVFSDEISQPILSVGRLMNAGWSICAQTRSLRNGAYEIRLDFRTCSNNWRAASSDSSFEGRPHSRIASLPGQCLWMASRWNTLGRSSPERQVPRSPLHLWHCLHGGVAENDSGQKGWHLGDGGIPRKSFRNGWAQQVHRGDTWENNSGHILDRWFWRCRNYGLWCRRRWRTSYAGNFWKRNPANARHPRGCAVGTGAGTSSGSSSS